MARILASLIVGLVFGGGIVVSGMSNPAKILNFFDFAGNWDPSLALVMGAALTITAIGYRLVLRRPAPVLDSSFHLPTKREVDLPLVGGAAVFGIGWGIAGFCPGGSIPALGLGKVEALVFVGAMLVGLALARLARGMIAAR
ncbi:DUF6691 family protein [Xanthobacter sp. TB0136]|uniref:DUF6691 family protein n=1 Tax=Xanthobacter sp. TB0136 TaxID=3459177 RepID=UPI00403A31BA